MLTTRKCQGRHAGAQGNTSYLTLSLMQCSGCDIGTVTSISNNFCNDLLLSPGIFVAYQTLQEFFFLSSSVSRQNYGIANNSNRRQRKTRVQHGPVLPLVNIAALFFPSARKRCPVPLANTHGSQGPHSTHPANFSASKGAR